jgi:hypothetical protein
MSIHHAVVLLAITSSSACYEIFPHTAAIHLRLVEFVLALQYFQGLSLLNL